MIPTSTQTALLKFMTQDRSARVAERGELVKLRPGQRPIEAALPFDSKRPCDINPLGDGRRRLRWTLRH